MRPLQRFYLLSRGQYLVFTVFITACTSKCLRVFVNSNNDHSKCVELKAIAYFLSNYSIILRKSPAIRRPHLTLEDFSFICCGYVCAVGWVKDQRICVRHDASCSSISKNICFSDLAQFVLTTWGNIVSKRTQRSIHNQLFIWLSNTYTPWFCCFGPSSCSFVRFLAALTAAAAATIVRIRCTPTKGLFQFREVLNHGCSQQQALSSSLSRTLTLIQPFNVLFLNVQIAAQFQSCAPLQCIPSSLSWTPRPLFLMWL